MGRQFAVYEITGQMCKYVCIMVFVTSALQWKNIGNYLMSNNRGRGEKNEKKRKHIHTMDCHEVNKTNDDIDLYQLT